MGLSLSLAAGAPCEASRDSARDQAYQSLVEKFQRPKAYWTSTQVGEVPGLLRTELTGAKRSGDNCGVLGVLDLIDDLDRLSPDEENLQAQVLWASGEHKAGEKASRDTALGPFFKAMLREEKGKKAVPGSWELLRAERYLLLRVYITWPGLRDVILRSEGARILGTEAYLLKGAVPEGFDEDWLQGLTIPPAPWEAAWGRAWEARDLPLVHGLLERSVHYCPQGVPTPLRTQVAEELGHRWELPYQWAELGLGAPKGKAFPDTFRFKLSALQELRKESDEALETAESSLAKLADNPRDHYELARLRLKIGSEEALKRLIADREALLSDPQVPGWSLEKAQGEIRGAEERVASLEAEREAEAQRAEEARLAELKRQEEAQRIALAKERAHREKLNRWNAFQRTRGELGAYVERGNEQLQVIYRAAAAGEPVQAQIDLLHTLVAPALAYPGTANALRDRMRLDWARGAGQSIAGDTSIPNDIKGRVFGAVKRALEGIHAASGAVDPEEVEE